jgi:hypothetical protein
LEDIMDTVEQLPVEEQEPAAAPTTNKPSTSAEHSYGLRFRSRLGLSEPLRSQAKDAERILNCHLDDGTLYFLVQWRNVPRGLSTWERSDSDMLVGLKKSYEDSLVPKTFYSSLDVVAELEHQPAVSTADEDVPAELIGRSRRAKGDLVQRPFKDCSARSGLDKADLTFGGMYGMCPCGYMAPPWEIIGAESCTIVSIE